MRALEKLADDGKIRFIGVSNFSLTLLRQAQSYLTKHEIVANQVQYNLGKRKAERYLLPFAEKERLTVMAFSPFGCPPRVKYAYGTAYLLHFLRKGKGVLEEIANKYNKTVAQICLNWIIGKKPVITIPKAVNIKHMEENVRATNWRMQPEDYQRLNKTFQHH
jgi:diketogulonate reductase-like aldo/keto reductase